MATVSWTWSILALLVLAHLLRQWALKSWNKNRKLPPGPRGFPILGSLHSLGEFPHRNLQRLAQKYGPIMHLRLGFVPVIVVSSPQAAELFLKAHDLVFASRPPSSLQTQYGSYWRNIRKMCTLELLSNVKIDSFKSMKNEETGLLVKFIQEAASNCVAVDLSAKVTSLNADMSCRMVFGKKYEDKDLDEKGFKAVMQEAVSKIFDNFFEKIIDEHIQSKDENKTNDDFVDVMLRLMGSKESEYSIERSNIKAIILHPRVMKKLQKELENVVGLKRMVEEADLDRLEYMDMVVKETLRLHPVAPLLLSHEAREDCTVNGFHIPGKSRVMINVWAIGRDPSVWSDAEKFIPERFVGSNIDLRGREFRLIPFGAGRRGCPGMQMGLIVVRLVIAQLVHCFDWVLANNIQSTELDMTEVFGLTVPRAKHLFAIPRYRLRH
ncbi:hypothetical protein CIPAW_03G135900 [Carya illinoinensis]|uniref:Cytochrome P450 n=1 Tax=Carya illinoinensis TaxID=32201 RepID=A0A8T1R0J1_CARIL|nr:hypothetical protein CIPAW_03G135900 [Carya illinoinensis]